MPEGDSVWKAARRLREQLAGRTVVQSDLRVPQHATADLSGWPGDTRPRGTGRA